MAWVLVILLSSGETLELPAGPSITDCQSLQAHMMHNTRYVTGYNSQCLYKWVNNFSVQP
ncbi:hypothetical protein ETP1_007 [Edwardsiella phage ETP-1]|nr:hypothetical protein ETP1_007 [Edwardsiella phage ETP-1]